MTTVTSVRANQAAAGARDFVLHVVHPPEIAGRAVLADNEVVIGRDPGVGGILVGDATISRRHATLVWSETQGAHLLRDLGSRNGSKVDGLDGTGKSLALVNGSLLRLGDVLLVYERSSRPDDVDSEALGEAIPGKAASMRALRTRIAHASGDPAPVLILGETGTGKEHIARQIHHLSARSGNFVALNCASLSTHLVESQLFGHGKGAFTGASEAQPGLFRAADKGTLFLDEIGDLPLELQPKLLRVLQEGEVLPVGSTRPVRVDVRVLAATHRDLVRAVEEQSFREDLYARLALWEVHVPPLRARRADILDWTYRLRDLWGQKRGQPASWRLSVDAAEYVIAFSWPLNLRGLERLVHELCSGGARNGVVSPSALPSWLKVVQSDETNDEQETSQEVAAKRTAIPTREEFVLAHNELAGSVRALARRFGRDRRQIYRWLTAYGLDHRS